MIGNLTDKLLGRYKHDSRFRGWVKTLTGVDMKAQNGYAFQGEFVRSGTVEYGPGYYLVAAVRGSRANQTTYYHVVKVAEDGSIEEPGIETDSSEAGWALRIRAQVAELLGQAEPQVSPLAGVSTALLFIELQNRGEVIQDEDGKFRFKNQEA